MAQVTQATRSRVLLRDAKRLWAWEGAWLPFDRWLERRGTVCVVPMLDPSNRHSCKGPQTIDHVKEEPGAVRKHDAGHLVAMCWDHNVTYPPSKVLRLAERAYLGL